jgi:hypothetical protein
MGIHFEQFPMPVTQRFDFAFETGDGGIEVLDDSTEHLPGVNFLRAD